MIVSITIPGAPVPKGRPRLSTRGGFARAYTPEKTRAYEDRIRIEALAAMGSARPLEGPVTVSVTAYVAAPKAMPKRRRAAAYEGIEKPVTRPDLDNYGKLALDACNGILFRDDGQVTDLILRKRFADFPSLVITVVTDDIELPVDLEARPIGDLIRPIINALEVA